MYEHEHLVSIPMAALTAAWISMPWWLHLVADFSSMCAVALPIIGVAVGSMQITYWLRKLRKK
jgi:hypothetical protein